MKRAHRYSIVIVFILVIGAVIFQLNDYLATRNLLFYSKGTDQKALINATWRMSVKEVERANGCPLKDGYDFSAFEPDIGFLLDPDRILWKKSCDKNIWGYLREVNYDFFDNQLFRIRIFDNIIDQAQTDSIIVTNLETKFGPITRNMNIEYSGTFHNEIVSVDYSQFKSINDNGELIKRFKIELVYMPIYDEIKKIAKKNQEEIF